ncbi:MAG: signal peptidase II [Acidimicrobiales bacterium]
MSLGSGARERRRRLVLLGAVALVVLTADQVTKSLAVAHLQSHAIHIAGPFSLRLEYNSGIAFSIGTTLTGPIILVAGALVLVVVWLARRVPTTLSAVAVGLILGGAVGNLSDRIFRGHHGAVVDFLYTRYWPTFNVADASIVCGCALLAWSVLRLPSGGRPTDEAVADAESEVRVEQVAEPDGSPE